MKNTQVLNNRESVSINIMKAVAVLSVIAAHVVPISSRSLFSNILSSCWCLFGKVGVVIFFVIGGFLYHREENDGKTFWKKKLYRIVIPWLFCSTITYAVSVILGRSIDIFSYFRWILGSGTWYYYITIYTLFLFIFKWLYKSTLVLSLLIAVQCISLVLASAGIMTTISLSFFTDYLNPLHWIGYFSFGILIKKYRLDLMARERKIVESIAYLIMAVSIVFLYLKGIFTYFHIISSVFCLSALVVIFNMAYRAALMDAAKYIGIIGSYSYCIYLFHMQIVQGVVSRIPDGILKIAISPIIGLGIMLMLILLGLNVCKKIAWGGTIKALVGL